MEQAKLERLLRVMQLLTDKTRRYTINELADILEISARSVYRYINTFESVGFIVHKQNNLVWLAKESRHFKTIADLVYFTEEEAYVLKRAVEALDPMNPAVNGIKNKLYSLYDFGRVADITVDDHVRKAANALMDAMASENQVILKGYRSSHSGNVSDRVVEPFQFGTNMVDVLCYEISSGICKSFKVSRIDEVEMLDKDWEHRDRHEKTITDAFRFSGKDKFEIELKLSIVAANLLMEEYPLTTEKMEKVSDNEYLYKDFVCSYEGVGRFVLGLCNEVEVVKSREFIDFLKRKRKGSKLF